MPYDPRVGFFVMLQAFNYSRVINCLCSTACLNSRLPRAATFDCTLFTLSFRGEKLVKKVIIIRLQCLSDIMTITL